MLYFEHLTLGRFEAMKRTALRNTLIAQARSLFAGCSETENLEYLRGMCELIAYSTPDPHGDMPGDAVEKIQALVLDNN